LDRAKPWSLWPNREQRVRGLPWYRVGAPILKNEICSRSFSRGLRRVIPYVGTSSATMIWSVSFGNPAHSFGPSRAKSPASSGINIFCRRDKEIPRLRCEIMIRHSSRTKLQGTMQCSSLCEDQSFAENSWGPTGRLVCHEASTRLISRRLSLLSTDRNRDRNDREKGISFAAAIRSSSRGR